MKGDFFRLRNTMRLDRTATNSTWKRSISTVANEERSDNEVKIKRLFDGLGTGWKLCADFQIGVPWEKDEEKRRKKGRNKGKRRKTNFAHEPSPVKVKRATHAEVFSWFLVNENFSHLTYSSGNKLHVDRSRSGLGVLNQVTDAKESLTFQIRQFHAHKRVLGLKRKVSWQGAAKVD